jgi:hypothetical protein
MRRNLHRTVSTHKAMTRVLVWETCSRQSSASGIRILMIRFAPREMPTTKSIHPDEGPARIPETSESVSELDSKIVRRSILNGLLGAYVNIVAYGFAYGGGNHQFELPLVNWLRDRSLYPNDPITAAFAHFPTIFWPVIARTSQWLGTERVVFLLFLLTKLLFFVALARLVFPRVKNNFLAVCIVLSVALSPFLNGLTPFGASNILDSIQTHTSLAIALVLWVGCFLLEGRWIRAAVLCALTLYINALLCVFMLFAFAAIALLDWRRCRNAIVAAGLLGAGISLPWLLILRGAISQQAPPGYVEALLAYYPFHFTLHSHEPYELIRGAGLVLAAALMVVIARKSGQPRDFRFEILTASFLVPVSLGALIGEIHLTPLFARLQFLRADSFLLLYSILLIQIYGANHLSSRHRGPATTFFLCSTAILLPLSDSSWLPWLVFLGMFPWAVCSTRFEKLWRAIGQSLTARLLTLPFFVAGILIVGRTDSNWSSTVIVLLLILVGCCFVYGRPGEGRAGQLIRLTSVISVLTILAIAAGTAPSLTSFWNPIVPLTPMESDWRAVQEWARENTSREAQFLVPTYPGGFRAFSERSSWGEWEDGTALHHYPAFTNLYRQRMLSVGYSWNKWGGVVEITENYKHLSWEHLETLARRNHLSYIIQFRETSYPVAPTFANQHYAVYKVDY